MIVVLYGFMTASKADQIADASFRVLLHMVRHTVRKNFRQLRIRDDETGVAVDGGC